MPKEGINMNPVVRVTRSRCRRIESIDSDNSERSNTPSVLDLDSKKSETPPLLTKEENSPEEKLRHITDTPIKRITRRAQSEIKLLDGVNSPLRRRTRKAGSVLLDENSKDVISHDEETKSPPPSATNQQQLQQTPVPGRRITRRSSVLLNESCELTPVLVSSPSRRTRRRNSMNLTEEQDEVITMKIQKNTLLDTCVPEEDVENDNLSTVEKQDQNNDKNDKTNDNANTLFPALCTRSRSKSPNVINLDTINEENETPQKNNFNVEAKEASQNNYEKELITNESKVEKDNDKINRNQDESIKTVFEENKNEEEFTEKSENDLVVLKIDEISDDKIENESNLNKSNNKIEKGKLSKSFNEKIETDEVILENTSKINKLNLSGGNILHKLNKISEFNNNSKLNDSIQPMEVDETISEVEVFFSKKEDKESNKLLEVETNILSKLNNQNLEKSSNNFNETTKLYDSKHSETENNNSLIENENTVDEIAQNDKSDKENIEINNKTATPTTTTVAQAILKSKYNDGIENVITPFKKRMSSELTASSTPIVTNVSIDEKQNYSITKDVSHNKEDEIKKLETLVEYEENSLNKIDNNSSSKKRQNVIISDLTVINDKSSKFPKTPLPSKTRSRITDDDDSIDNDKSSSSTKESENKSLNETDLLSSNKKSSKIRNILNLSESSSLSLLNNSKNNNEKDENNSKSRCNDFAKSWSQSVKGTADTTIDSFGLKKNISNNDCKDPDTSNKSDTQKSFKKKYIEESEDDDEEEEESKKKNDFIDDEAEEVSDSDSLDSEEREYLKQNEVSERGESLGSQDTDNYRSDGDNEETDEEIASFIVSDGEEVENEEDMGEEEEEGEEAKMSVDEDDDNDESESGNVNRKKEFEKKRRSRQIISSSEDEEDETKQKSTTENQNEEQIKNEEEKEKPIVVTGILENKLDNEAENNDKNEESAILKNNDDEPTTQKSSEELNTTNNYDLGETVEGELLMSVNVLETTTDHKFSLDENLINNDQINSNKKGKISLDKSIVTSTVTSEINIEKEIFPIKKTRQSLPARRMSLYLPQNYRETKSEEKEIRIASDNKKISKKLNDKHDEDQTGSIKNKDSDESKIIEKSTNANVENSCRSSNDISFLNLKYIFEKRSVEDNVDSDSSDSDSVDNADDKNQGDNVDKIDENNDNAENSSNDNNAENSCNDNNTDHDDDSDSGDNVDKNVDGDGDDDKSDNNDDGDNNDNSGYNKSENSSDEDIDENETEINHDLQDSKDNKTNTSQEESGDNDDFITRIMKRCNEVLEQQTKNEVKIPNKNKSKTNKKKKLKQQKKEIEEKDQKETGKSLKPEKQVEKALKFSEKLLQKKIKNSKPMKLKSCEEENIKTTSPKKIVNVITNKTQLNKEKNTNKKSIKTSPLKKSVKDDVMIKQGKRKISDVSIEEPKDKVEKKKKNITAIIKNPSGLIYEEPLPSSSNNNKIKISEFSWGIVKEESVSNETSSKGFKETPLTPKSHKFKIDEYHKKPENSKVGKNKNKKETVKDYSWGCVYEQPLQMKPTNISKFIGHKLNKAMSAGQIEPPTLNKNKNKKNKKIISEPTTVPPKPSWVKNSKELQSSSSVGSLIRIPIGGSTDDNTGTDFFLQPLTGKKRKRQAIDTISQTALQFKKKTSSNDKIPRETSKQLLQKKDKQRFNYY